MTKMIWKSKKASLLPDKLKKWKIRLAQTIQETLWKMYGKLWTRMMLTTGAKHARVIKRWYSRYQR